MEPDINYGVFWIAVSNNDYQFTTLNRTLEILPGVKIMNVWPSVFSVSDINAAAQSNASNINLNRTLFV
jgi:hypothetical protein